MELEVAEALAGHDVALADRDDAPLHRPVGGSLPVRFHPTFQVLATKDDDRTFGRLGPSVSSFGLSSDCTAWR